VRPGIIAIVARNGLTMLWWVPYAAHQCRWVEPAAVHSQTDLGIDQLLMPSHIISGPYGVNTAACFVSPAGVGLPFLSSVTRLKIDLYVGLTALLSAD